MALVVAALASCKKTYVTNTTVPNQTFSVTVAVTSWVLTTDTKAYAVDVPVKGNYQFFNGTDVTIAELSFDTGTSAKTYEPMPYVYNNVSYSYTHYVGTDGLLHIVLYSQPVGGGAVVKPASDIIVKLVLIPSS